MKKIISSILIVLLAFSFISCSRNSTPSETESEVISEQEVNNLEESNSSFAPRNADGLEELSVDMDSGTHAKSNIKEGYYDEPFDEDEKTDMLVSRYCYQAPVKVHKNELTAVTGTNKFTYFGLYKIKQTEPYYTIPYNFADLDNKRFQEDEVYCLPYTFPDNKHYPGDFMIDEIDGVDLKEAINSNYRFFTSGWKNIYESNIYYYKLYNLKKGQTVTMGGYVQTEWKEITLTADVEYYLIEDSDNNSIKCDVQKTKNGYFTVDLSKFENGLYYFSAIHTVIELV